MIKNQYWNNFVKENRELWHYDPMVTSQDYTYIGRLKTDFNPLLELMEDDRNFTKHVMVQNIKEYEGELSERIKAFTEWGFNEHNTQSLQMTDDDFPEIFKRYKKFAGFEQSKVVALKQHPGQALPWHGDTLVGFKKQYNVPEDRKVVRYSLFLEDWNWGHYFAVGNNVIHQWKQGDIIQFPPKIHHVTCNVGMVPKLTMTVTGTETEKSIKLKKNGKFEL